jgi:hypothetical protein
MLFALMLLILTTYFSDTVWHRPKSTKTDKNDSPASGAMISPTLQEWEKITLQNI